MPQLPGQSKARRAHDNGCPLSNPDASCKSQSLGQATAFHHGGLIVQDAGQDEPAAVRKTGPLIPCHLAQGTCQNVRKNDVKRRSGANPTRQISLRADRAKTARRDLIDAAVRRRRPYRHRVIVGGVKMCAGARAQRSQREDGRPASHIKAA